MANYSEETLGAKEILAKPTQQNFYRKQLGEIRHCLWGVVDNGGYSG